MSRCCTAERIVFFDLDGPLLDVSGRYGTVHRDVLQKLAAQCMEPSLYWQRKRAKCSEEAILAEIGLERLAASYIPTRLSQIETPKYLTHDRVWPWTASVVRTLGQSSRLVVVTARAKRESLLDQLVRIDLLSFFHEVLSEAGGQHVDEQKAALMSDYLKRHKLRQSGHWMIGDTEADISAGQRLRFTTVGVLCGIRDRHHLASSGPDFLLDDIRELPFVRDEKSHARMSDRGGNELDLLQRCSG